MRNMIRNEESRKCMEKTIDNLKAKGTFDELRRECMADVDIKPSYRNLLQRVEGYVSKFLYRQKWSPSLNKNQLRNRLRNEINESEMLRNGIIHLIDQVVNDNLVNQFNIKIKEALYDYLGITINEGKSPEDETNKHDQGKIVENEKDQNDYSKEVENSDKKEEVDKEKGNNDEKISATDSVPEGEVQKGDHEPNFQVDLETEDNLNVEPMNIVDDDENENVDNINDVDMDIEWPSPPKPEQLTPEQIKNESMDSLQIDESYCDVNDEANELEQSKNDIKCEDIKIEKPIDEFNTENESSNLSIPKNLDFFSQDSQKSELELEPEPEKVTENITDNKSDISDVSSVHTSDLSDFDDEISIEGSDSDEAPKKKISLKVVKELAASITDNKQESTTTETRQDSRPNTPIDVTFEKKDNKEDNGGNKRKRKVNPKFLSSEYSYKNNNNNSKGKKFSLEPTEIQQDPEDKQEEQQLIKKRKRISETETSVKQESTPKIFKMVNEKPKQSSSIKKTETSTIGNNKNNKNKNRKPNRNDQKRYDSSDLYKPRHRLISSRRGRSLADPLTPESNSNSNDNDNTEK